MLSALDLTERDYSVSRRYQRKPRVGDTDPEFRSRSQLAKASQSDVLTTKPQLGEVRRERAREQRYLQQGTDESKAYVVNLERRKHIEGRSKKLLSKNRALPSEF